ncbi:hypothetical protein CDD83_3340 [Cordyceps sp. RAO-2017]|nr:hypothetical protein CDD83_3340 [Cordyceps sp. RAO-2017]
MHQPSRAPVLGRALLTRARPVHSGLNFEAGSSALGPDSTGDDSLFHRLACLLPLSQDPSRPCPRGGRPAAHPASPHLLERPDWGRAAVRA